MFFHILVSSVKKYLKKRCGTRRISRESVSARDTGREVVGNSIAKKTVSENTKNSVCVSSETRNNLEQRNVISVWAWVSE